MRRRKTPVYKANCKHCDKVKNIYRRGLCKTCNKKPEIRLKYPVLQRGEGVCVHVYGKKFDTCRGWCGKRFLSDGLRYCPTCTERRERILSESGAILTRTVSARMAGFR